MEWLWLFLGVAGLGLLWLLIKGMEKLTDRLKIHDEARRQALDHIAERTAEAETAFIEEQLVKDHAKNYIENADLSDQENPENVAILQDAIQTLSSAELVQSVAKRMFGTPEGTNSITATQSIFDQVNPKKVVAKGESATPIKVKPATKSSLSKAEQKMLKKIRQGD